MTPRLDCLGRYGDRFGIPELEVTLSDDHIESISVIRGAPCGATWKAAEAVIGSDIKEAAQRYGLEIQFLCTAGGTGRNAGTGKNPIHLAAEVHGMSLQRGLRQSPSQ